MKNTTNRIIEGNRKWYERRRLYWVKTPSFLRRMHGNNVIWSLPHQPDKLFITFDDGPVPSITGEVLRILGEYDVKATFFCVGDNVRRHPDTYEKILENGHLTGNHTFNHLNGWKTNNYHYIANTLKAKKYIDSPLFRPPYGKISPLQAKAIGRKFKIIMWSLLSADFDNKQSPEDCFRVLEKHTQGGSIVVFHDSLKARARLLKILPAFIEDQLKKGFIFETLNEQILKGHE